MEKLTKEYTEILSSDKNASEKFWELEKRINQDKKNVGVITEMRRSNVYPCLVEMLNAEIITVEDLEGFSDDLITAVTFVLNKE